MVSAALLISSFAALALLVVHSALRRGGRVTAAFFISGAVFGILRGNAVDFVCRRLSGAAGLGKPYLPQGEFLPHVGSESLQVVVGWLFASYLAWTSSEYVLRRLRAENRLFPTVALSALFLCAIGWCMEAAAPRVGWWYWSLSAANPAFGNVPPAGIAAWFSVATDFLIPFLFIVCSEHRRSPWRWLTLLVFPLHIGAHALYDTVPYIDNIYAAMAVAVVAAGLFLRARIEVGLLAPRPGVANFIPAVAVVTFIAVLVLADTFVANAPTLALAALPLVVFALLAAGRLPVYVAFIAAAAGLAGWPWMGARALWGFAPIAAFAVFYGLERAKNPRPFRWALLAASALVAGVLVAGEVSDHRDMARFTDGLVSSQQARAAGNEASAKDSFDRACAVKIKDPTRLWLSVKIMVEVYAADLDFVLPEMKRRYAEIARLDPQWTAPRIEWVQWLAADNQVTEAIAQCRAAVEAEPRVGAHHAVLGYLLLRSGQYGEGSVELRDADRLGVKDPSALINFAIAMTAYYCLPDPGGKAEGALTRALVFDPSNPVAQLDLADLKADPCRIRPDLAHIATPDGFGIVGILLSERAERRAAAGDWPGAVRLMEQAVHYGPKSGNFRANYALALSESGAPAQGAIEQCELALRFNPNLPAPRALLVQLSLRLAGEQAARRDPASARATLQRALPYASGEAINRIQEALKALR